MSHIIGKLYKRASKSVQGVSKGVSRRVKGLSRSLRVRGGYSSKSTRKTRKSK